MEKNTIVNTFTFTFVDRLICSHPVYFSSNKNHQQIVKSQPSYYCEYISNVSNDGFALQGFTDQFKIKFQPQITKNDEFHHLHHYVKAEVCQNTDGHDQGEHIEDMVKIQQEKPNSQSEFSNFKPRTHQFVNDTKNIPKNFGKAIITFIQKNPHMIQKYLKNYNIEMAQMLQKLKQRKKCLHSIKQLRSLWIDQDFNFAKPFRSISYHFLRKGVFKYIFGSRITDYTSHLKYRFRIMDAIQNPKTFNSIKM